MKEKRKQGFIVTRGSIESVTNITNLISTAPQSVDTNYQYANLGQEG